MNATTEDIVEKYARLKKQISELENELDTVKDEVFSLVNQSGGELERDDYVFKCTKRPKYKHSDVYEHKNTELKELKKNEIKEGVATIESYSEFITFRLKKPKT
ncbi:MAG: hypothetical protein ACI87E_003010 [Mariniblastus sp.]|jgi:uncharacterized protein (DUF342 family)